MSRKSGALTYRMPKGLLRPVVGKLCMYYFYCYYYYYCSYYCCCYFQYPRYGPVVAIYLTSVFLSI
jgi:hypothetical protein